MIPKLIHFIWIPSFSAAPEYAEFNISKWKELNPEYEVKVWEEEEILEEINPSRVDVFRSLKMDIKKADFARLEIIVKYGGVYLDCDIDPNRPISYFLNKKKLERPNCDYDVQKKKKIFRNFVKRKVDISQKRLILSREWINPNFKTSIFTPRIRVANGVIISVQGNELLERFLQQQHRNTSQKVLQYLGPHSMTRFLERQRNRMQLDDLCVIPPQHFLWEQKVGPMPKWSIAKHMGKNTWGDHSKFDFWNIR